MMARCLLALGSNLGDRSAILSQACAALSALPRTHLLARSRWHPSTPVGGAPGQGEFLNGAVLLETSQEPAELLKTFQAIESQLGRQRAERWDARTIDIDILLYGDEIIETVELTIPHPRMSFRPFVLEPAAEIAGPLIHPTAGWTLARLWSHLQTPPPRVVITAAKKHFAEWLVSQLCAEFPGLLVVGNDKSPGEASDAKPGKRIEFPQQNPLQPVLSVMSPEDCQTLATHCVHHESEARPALVIALDLAETTAIDAAARSAGFASQPAAEKSTVKNLPSLSGNFFPGLGPVAKITTDNPEIIMQEATAALTCLWPGLN